MMKRFVICLILISSLILNVNSFCSEPSVTIASGTHAPQEIICPGDLIFEDNFDEFDLKKWEHEETFHDEGKGAFQWYTNSRYNTYAFNSTLFIKPTLLADEIGEEQLYSGYLDINGGAPAEMCTNPFGNGCARTGTQDIILNPIKSARLRTLHSLSFRYGKVEIRAKCPAGDWLWPVILLMPRYNQYARWPASGEIDMLNGRGNRELVNLAGDNIGTHLADQRLVWGPTPVFNQWPMTQFTYTNSQGFDTDFHRYQLEWTPDSVIFFIDDQVSGNVTPPVGGFWELGNLTDSGLDNPWKYNSKMAPFDQEFYLILTLAVGGLGYFPDDALNPGGKPWGNGSPRPAAEFWEGRAQWQPTWQPDTSSFQFDYVRIWAL